MTLKNDLSIYDDYADVWWRGSERWLRTLHAMTPARLRFFDKAIGGWSGLRVLDLGCGGGFMSEALVDRGATTYGLDPAAGAIAAARRHAEETGRAIDYQVGVGEALPYDDRAFDAVVCVDVLEHVSDLDKTLSEVRRVLKPGGWFLFDTINRNPIASAVVVFGAERVLKLLPRGTHDPALFIKPSELSSRLEALGFTLGRMRGLGPIGVDRRFDFRFGTHPLTTIIYIGTARLPEGEAISSMTGGDGVAA